MGRKSRAKRRHREEDRLLQEAWERLVSQVGDEWGTQTLVREHGSAGVEKLSERLLRLATPLTNAAQSKQSFRTAIAVAVMAWNLALLPESAWPAEGTELGGGEGRMILESLVERKKAMFPDDGRRIVSYEIIDQGSELRLNVFHIHPEGDDEARQDP